MTPETERPPSKRTAGDPAGDAADTDRLRVLLLAEDFYPRTAGGAALDWTFARRAVRRGHAVTVYADRLPGTERRETRDGVDIRRPRRIGPVDAPLNSVQGQLRRALGVGLLALQLLVALRDEEFDVVYATNHATYPVAAVLGLVYGLPVVDFVGYSPSVGDRDGSTPTAAFLLESLNVRLFMGDLVLCQVPAMAELVAERSHSPTRRIDGVVDADRLRAVAGTHPSSGERAGAAVPPDGSESADAVELAFVGRLSPLKNPTAAVDVLAALPPQYRLTVVGQGPQAAPVRDRVETLGVGDRVDLCGELPHEETLARIAGSDALLLTSDADAYPAVVFEALSLGTPVVATPVGALPDVDHPNLHVADPDEFPAVLRSLDFDGPSGLDRDALDRFSVERYVDTALESLRSVCRD